MAYTRINWENEPSVNTPVNEDNLNHMEDGIVQNETDIAGKMDANNPTGTGSLQVGTGNMKTDGNPSYALGYNAYAEGDNSFAFGSSTRAKKQGAYAMGSHAEAREYFSMALGEEVIAASIHQTVRGKYNEIDADGVYLDIVGGGNPLERKNVETLTPNGDKWVAGDYTNGNGETLHGIYEALPTDTESGNPAVITDAFGGACKSLKLTLEPIQSGSGEKNPQNPYVISGRSSVDLNRCGKNVFPLFTEETKNGITLSYSNGKLILDGTANGTAFFNISNLAIPSANYVISCNNSATANVHLTMRKIGGTSDLFDIPLNAVNKTTTINNSIGSITMHVVSGTVLSNYEIGYQAEIGTTATDYEPYNVESITRTYGVTIYGGTDGVTGEGATSTYNLVNLSDLSWSDQGTPNTYQATISDLVVPSNDIVCSHYPTTTATTSAANMPDKSIKTYGLSNLHTVIVKNSDYPTLASFTASLTGVQLAYPTTSPTSIPLTSQNVALLHGDNVLTTDADSIEASYSADIALYIAKKIAEGSQNNRSLSKGGSSDEESKDEEKEEEKKEEIEIKEEPLTKEVR